MTQHPDIEARAATPYMILVGERRWRAARLAPIETVPAIVRSDEISAGDRLLLQLAENDERSDLSLLEQARAYHRAYKLSGLAQGAFARKCGKTDGWLSHLFRLVRADGLVREALEEKLINTAHTARVFTQLSAPAQLRLLQAARRTGQAITDWRLQAALEREAQEREGAPDADGEDAEDAGDAEAPDDPPPASLAGSRTSATERDAETVTITLTFAQIKDLLRFLGARPLPTAKAAADQLVKILATSAAA